MHHIAHLLWYSQPCWRTQDFLMKPVTIHHILIFSFYIALKCQKLNIPKPHLNNPPRCPCRTQIFLTFGHRTGKEREFKWLRHIAHLLWYSQPCWRTQDFLMKPVAIHHILIFSFYIALKCQKLNIPKPHLNNPPRCPCRTQTFLTFGHRTGKKMWIQVIASYCALALVYPALLAHPRFSDETRHHSSHFDFFFLHCTQEPKIENSKTPPKQPPRCPCRTQFFWTFGHQTKKQPCGQRILAMPANSVHDFAWQCVDFDADSALKKIIMSSNTWFDDGALVEVTAMSSKSVLPNQNMNELSFVERHQHPSKRCFDEAVLVKENLMSSKGKFFPTKISPDW